MLSSGADLGGCACSRSASPSVGQRLPTLQQVAAAQISRGFTDFHRFLEILEILEILERLASCRDLLHLVAQ